MNALRDDGARSVRCSARRWVERSPSSPRRACVRRRSSTDLSGERDTAGLTPGIRANACAARAT
jgi:hypothetical protein